MSTNMEDQVRAYADFLDSTLPVLEASDAMRAPLTQSAEAGVGEARGADLAVFDLRGPDPSPASTPRKRRVGVLAVAAAILLVVAVVVIPDRDDSSVETEPVSSATTPPDATLPPEEAGLPPSVVDSLGYRWSRVPHNEAVFGGQGWQAMSHVIAGGPGVVAVGQSIAVWDGEDYVEGAAVVWTSVDGLTWSRVPHDQAIFGGDGDNTSINSVVAGGPGLMAYGTQESGCSAETSPTVCDERNGVLWTSVDGLTWNREVPDGFMPEGGVTVGGPGFVAVGENEQGAEVWTSADGITWSRVPHDQEVFGHRIGHGNGMGAVTVGGPGFVAVGSDGVWSDNPTGEGQAVVWTSVDGLTWSRVPHDETVFGGPGDQAMFDVTVGGPGLVAVGQDAQGAPVWTSTDGIKWSRIPDPGEVFGGPSQTGTWDEAVVTDVVAGGLGLIAVGEQPHGVAAMWTSLDGLTWKREEAFAPYAAGPGGAIAVFQGGLVAVGSDESAAIVWLATPEK